MRSGVPQPTPYLKTSLVGSKIAGSDSRANFFIVVCPSRILFRDGFCRGGLP